MAPLLPRAVALLLVVVSSGEHAEAPCREGECLPHSSKFLEGKGGERDHGDRRLGGAPEPSPSQLPAPNHRISQTAYGSDWGHNQPHDDEMFEEDINWPSILFGGGFICVLVLGVYGFFFYTRQGRLWIQQNVQVIPPLPGDVNLPMEILLPLGARCPRYWTNQDLDKEFDERYPADNLLPVVQAMFDATWKDIVTRDRKGGKPDRLEVVSVQRFEDKEMWSAYLEQKDKIIKRGRFQSVQELDGNPFAGQVLTDRFVRPLTHGEGLNPLLNEHYLFHGTSPEAAENISEDGFRINLAGSSAGTMFGKGAYFAECSSKADEYAQSGRGVFQKTNEYAILLSRVCCGRMHRALRAREKESINNLVQIQAIDGVLGDREASVGTYREFVVFKQAQIYPEYRVLYRRIFDDAQE